MVRPAPLLGGDVHRLRRLAKYLDGFAGSFVRGAQVDNARRYVRGLLSDAKRKNMEGMLARLSDPGQYQALQHFITHSTWNSELVWQELRAQVPERCGYLLLDDTSIPKQGKESVGVARQYCGALGKVANCQVVVTAALRTKKAVWPLAMDLYLPQEWCEDEDRRERARVPVGLKPRTKTETAIAQLDLVRAAGINITCVLADAGYGDATEFRDSIAKRKLFYSVGVAKTTKVFLDKPTLRVPEGRPGGRPRTRPELAPRSAKPKTLEQIANAAPRSAWRSIAWRKGTKGPLRAEFLIVRVTPAHRWYNGERFEQVWLICERTTGKESIRKYYLSNLPADLAAKKLVSITHERWAIEMHYRDLKQETALDHFEGRSFPGFNRHLVLTAIAYSFLERERRRSQSPLPSIGAVREAVTEVVVMMLFASGERFARRTLRFIRDPPRI